jgi:hypothetical protein
MLEVTPVGMSQTSCMPRKVIFMNEAFIIANRWQLPSCRSAYRLFMRSAEYFLMTCAIDPGKITITVQSSDIEFLVQQKNCKI